MPTTAGDSIIGKHDDRGPQVVAFEFLVDQIGQREADQNLQDDRPDQEMRGGLHRVPDVGVGQDALVVAQTDPFNIAVRTVDAEVREAQPDRPDQRKDVHRQQQEDRRRYEDPGDRAIRKPSNTLCNAAWALLAATRSMGDFVTIRCPSSRPQ